jgi:hypothetical protein
MNTHKDLIDDAKYECYKYNRQRSPELAPELYKKVFDNVDAMEEKYQKELQK